MTRLYCRCGNVFKAPFQPEPKHHICSDCQGWMGTFKPRSEKERVPVPAERARKRNRKRSGFTPASPQQRAKVRDQVCVVCARDRFEAVIHPAHLASRAQGGGDDPLDVVALCAEHHRLFDNGRLSLLEHLEPMYRNEVAQAVRHLGLVGALHRLTGERWAPENVKEDAA